MNTPAAQTIGGEDEERDDLADIDDALEEDMEDSEQEDDWSW